MSANQINTIRPILIILLISLFLYTAVAKTINYETFRDEISEFPPLSPFAPFILVALIFSEFCTTLLLLIPQWRLKGLYASLILLIIFTVYIVYLLATSNGTPCSCGGLIEALTLKQHILFNISFISISMLAISFEHSPKRQGQLKSKKHDL